MHRELQIKQFPIVTTHWWPKTRNERFVWENIGVSEAWCWRAVIVTPTNHILLWCCMNGIGYLHEAIWLADVSVGAWKVASAPRFRHALRQALTPRVNAAWARARAHTRHTPDVCALRSLGHGCVQEVKNNINCSFSHTNRSFRVLGHQCVITMGNCLIWISLCMFFFPLIETVTYTCHYMTDRLERFDLKTSKLDLLKKKRHLHLGCPWGKLIDTTF